MLTRAHSSAGPKPIGDSSMIVPNFLLGFTAKFIIQKTLGDKVVGSVVLILVSVHCPRVRKKHRPFRQKVSFVRVILDQDVGYSSSCYGTPPENLRSSAMSNRRSSSLYLCDTCRHVGKFVKILNRWGSLRGTDGVELLLTFLQDVRIFRQRENEVQKNR